MPKPIEPGTSKEIQGVEADGGISADGYDNLKAALGRLTKGQLAEISRMSTELLETARPDESDFEAALHGVLNVYFKGQVDQMVWRRKVISQLAVGGSPEGADKYKAENFKNWTEDDFKVLSEKIEAYLKEMDVDDRFLGVIVKNMRDVYQEYRKRLLQQWDGWTQGGDQKKIDDFFPGFQVQDLAKLTAGVRAREKEFDEDERAFRASEMGPKKMSNKEVKAAALKDMAGSRNFYSAAQTWLEGSGRRTLYDAQRVGMYFQGRSEDELRTWVHFAEGGS